MKEFRLLRRLSLVLVPLAVCLAPGVASAGPNDNSSSRPWSLQIGVGPSVHFGGAAHGRVGVDFQYHFFGGDVGPALGAQLYTLFRPNRFGMNVGPIFMWDFRVFEGGGFKLYLAPLIALGHGFWHRPERWTSHWFFMDVGGQLKGVWNDRVGFFVRPTNFSMWAGPPGATGYWTFLTGLTLSF